MFFNYLSYVAEQPVVTFSVFRFALQKRWKAFRRMGERFLLKNMPSGMTFGKMLGNGKNGFDIMPDFSQYSMLACWKNADEAEHFFSQNQYFKEYVADTEENYHIQMALIHTKGSWEGKNPFEGGNVGYDPKNPIIVLTRARIRTNKLLGFWKNVPQVKHAITHSSGLLTAFGIGELPLVEQATLSIWQNPDFMKNFAYQKTSHKDVVQKTRQQNWYAEDLFARFSPTATQGTYQGTDVIEEAVHQNMQDILV
jgi:hypothetical protein